MKGQRPIFALWLPTPMLPKLGRRFGEADHSSDRIESAASLPEQTKSFEHQAEPVRDAELLYELGDHLLDIRE